MATYESMERGKRQHMNECIMSRRSNIWMRCFTCEWVMSHTSLSHDSFMTRWMSHVTFLHMTWFIRDVTVIHDTTHWYVTWLIHTWCDESHTLSTYISQPTYAWVMWHMHESSNTPRIGAAHAALRANSNIFVVQHFCCATFLLCNVFLVHMKLSYHICMSQVTLQHTATLCNTLQHAATHCNTLHHTATHSSTPQHTATHIINARAKQHTLDSCGLPGMTAVGAWGAAPPTNLRPMKSTARTSVGGDVLCAMGITAARTAGPGKFQKSTGYSIYYVK